MQAVEIRGVEKMAIQTKRLYEKGREVVPSITKDRVFSIDIEKAAAVLQSSDFLKLIQHLDNVK
jgi:histidine ammonia-lyase